VSQDKVLLLDIGYVQVRVFISAHGGREYRLKEGGGAGDTATSSTTLGSMESASRHS
jgi:hypothetical protein